MTSQIKIVIVGDSTACNYKQERFPRSGWGQLIGQFFSDNIDICNKAASGRSSKSFYDEGRLDEALKLISKKDYFFIQFGHNDQKSDKKRFTSPNNTYKFYLKKYIEAARALSSVPVLLTPINRRIFEANGEIKNTHGTYPEAVFQVSTELRVPVIDMTKKSRILFEKLGKRKSKNIFLHLEKGEHPNYPDGVQDDTHFSHYGASKMAELVVEGIKEIELDLAKFIKN
ncbi:MAG: rhamnogalacturonan acetylesterase [bacterium]